MAEGKVRNKTQVLGSPETGEITGNLVGDSAVLQRFDRWLSDRFPAARMTWIRSSSLKLQIGTNLARNGRRKWENRPGHARGSGWIRFGFSSLSLFSSLFPFSLSLNIYGTGCGVLQSTSFSKHIMLKVITPQLTNNFKSRNYNKKWIALSLQRILFPSELYTSNKK